jgi:hypothetical protein
MPIFRRCLRCASAPTPFEMSSTSAGTPTYVPFVGSRNDQKWHQNSVELTLNPNAIQKLSCIFRFSYQSSFFESITAESELLLGRIQVIVISINYLGNSNIIYDA